MFSPRRGRARRTRSGPVAWIAILGAIASAAWQPTSAQQPKSATSDEAQTSPTADVAERSLPLRTALHHDPSLDASLERLTTMYREAGRLQELVDIYRRHTADYPNDANGAAVLVRLLEAAGDTQAAAVAKSSAEAHPNDAYLQYLSYQSLRRSRRTEATAALERAVSLTKSPRQKSAWMETLLDEAAGGEQPETVDKYLEEMAKGATTAEAKLEIAERMLKYSRAEGALAVLEQAAGLNPAPETGVRIQLTAAGAETSLDRVPAAASRLDKLLEKLAPDYWRRAEIVRRRISLVTSDEERNRMVEAARKRYGERPDEAGAADLASLLAGFERRREALAALLEAGEKLPDSQRLETMTLELIDRLRDERARRDYLSARIKKFPDRADLLVLGVKASAADGDRAEARRQIARLVEITPAENRRQMQIELARALLKLNPTSDMAAEVLQRVVDQDPKQYDLRRELAELYVKSGNRGRARELFAKDPPDDVAVESVLDFIPFLIEQEMFAEARKALRKAVRADEPNLDLRLLAADVERRTGNRAAAGRMLDAARSLADTGVRYKSWLEAAAALHEEDETIVDFLADELARLDEERKEWNEASIERAIAVLEIAGRGKTKAELADLASQYTDDETIPKEVRTKLRRQVVRILSGAKDVDGSLAYELEALVQEIPEAADEYRARLALLYLKSNAHHLVEPLLNEIRVERITDVKLLVDLEQAFTQFQRPHQAAATLERLIALEPAEKSHWEAWLYQSAVTGREERLRDSLRRLLSGVDGLGLEEPVRELLQAAEIDSYGRSILALLVDGREGPLSEALSLVAVVEKRTTTPQQALWAYWNRSFILNRLGRAKERDEAIGEMEKIFEGQAAGEAAAGEGELTTGRPAAADAFAAGAAASAAVAGTATKAGSSTNTASTGNSSTGPAATVTPSAGDDEKRLAPSIAADFDWIEGPEPRLRFPDGLSLSMANARRLLTSPPYEAAWPKADSRSGPLPQLRVGWAFDLPANRTVVQIQMTSPERLIVADSAGGLTGVDALTGKVLWERAAVLPAASGELHLSLSRTLRGQTTSQDVRVRAGIAPITADDRNRFYYAHRGEVVCLSAADGETVWRSTIDARYENAFPGATAKATSQVFWNGKEVLTYDPENDVVAAVDCETGRLLWTHDVSAGLPAAESRYLHWMNSGATFDGRRMFVYGKRAALVDVERHEVQWTIDPLEGDRVPLRLDAPAGPSATPGSMGSAPSVGSTGFYPPGSRYVSASASAPSQYSRPGYSRTPSYPGALPPPSTALAPRYVDYQRRDATATSPRTPIDTTLVGPAAKWSADSSSGQPRFAVLNDNRLMLGGTEGCSIMDTDLPIAGRRLSTVGTYVGRVGHMLCCLRGNELVIVDLSRGMRGSLRLSAVTGGEYNARVQVAVDGPLVYVTGSKGVYCFNVMARRRVFTAPWPAGALPEADDPNRPPETDLVDQSTHYLWNGAAVAVGPSAQCVPPVGAVAAGRLITAATPWRVVALEGIDAP